MAWLRNVLDPPDREPENRRGAVQALIRKAWLVATLAVLAVLLQPTPQASAQATAVCRRPTDGRPVLLVGAAALGDGWCLAWRLEGNPSAALYGNAVNYAAPREAIFDASLAPSQEEVLWPLLVLADVGLAYGICEGASRSLPLDEPELGDIAPLGLECSAEDGSFASVSYAFVVDRVNAFVSVRGTPDELEDLRAQALHFARLEEAHLRKVTPTLPAVLPSPPAAEDADDCMEFIADVTIPDGTEVDPGQEFDKVWLLANCGRTTWDGYRAVRTFGAYGPPVIDVPWTAPGDTVNLSARMEAPTRPGRQRSYYQLEGSNGSFGDTFFVEICVAGCPEPPVPPAEPIAGIPPPPVPGSPLWVRGYPSAGNPEFGLTVGCVHYVAQWSDGSFTSVPWACDPGVVAVEDGRTASRGYPPSGGVAPGRFHPRSDEAEQSVPAHGGVVAPGISLGAISGDTHPLGGLGLPVTDEDVGGAIGVPRHQVGGVRVERHEAAIPAHCWHR